MSGAEFPVLSTAAQANETHFVVGQDPQGRWLAIETHDRGGGLFKSLHDAMHFADAETGHRPGSVEIARTPLHLRF